MSLEKVLDEVATAMEGMRALAARNNQEPVMVEISTISDEDPEEMVLVQNTWVPAPWEGMSMMLTLVCNETCSRYLLCKTEEAMDLGVHRHVNHVEEVVMMEGRMRDRAHDQVILPGGRIKYPAGEPHWPVFDGPSLFMVIFRKVR